LLHYLEQSDVFVGVKPGRKVALLLNPIGGKGKARELVKTIALPILEAAGLQVEVYGTSRSVF
jgi:sphingosine kinase